MIADRWGVTDPEVARHYPCDDVLPAPTVQLWRGVSVAAEAERVWPWVAQIRVAPYSYDLIDNLGRRSPARLLGLAEPVVGDPFTTAFGRAWGSVVSVTPGEQLTGSIAGAVMSYVLVRSSGGCRLLLKVVAGGPRAFAPLLAIGDLVMARRQLLNLAALACA